MNSPRINNKCWYMLEVARKEKDQTAGREKHGLKIREGYEEKR